MDTLDHQNASLRKLKRMSVTITVACFHVVLGSHDLLAVDDCIDVLVHKLDIHRFDVVVVHVRPLLSSLVLGLSIEGEVVVVDSEGCGRHATVAKLLGQLGGEGGLSTGGGSCDAHHSNVGGKLARRISSVSDVLDDVHNARLLHKLCRKDEVLTITIVRFEFVEVSNTRDAVVDTPHLLRRHRPVQCRLRDVLINISQQHSLSALL
mmetsp:Transcript_23218/g.45270  ORF Transcript_23218/g.45270 Transcript_23218/m.45270 type:complete len:207 (-) Transcript_23218:451-1071(-)